MMDCMYEYWYYFTCHILNVILQSAGWSFGEWPLELDRANKTDSGECVCPNNKQHSAYRQKPTVFLSSHKYRFDQKKIAQDLLLCQMEPLFFVQLAGREVATDATRKVKGKLCGQGILRCHLGWEGRWSAVGSNFVWDASVMFNEWIQNFRIFDMCHWMSLVFVARLLAVIPCNSIDASIFALHCFGVVNLTLLLGMTSSDIEQ